MKSCLTKELRQVMAEGMPDDENDKNSNLSRQGEITFCLILPAEARMFHQLLPRRFSLRGGQSAWSAPWRNSHAPPGRTSSALGRSHKRRDYRMRSNPRPHHSCLHKGENTR